VIMGVVYDYYLLYSEAIHAYKESLERDPKLPLVLVDLSTTLMKQERFAHARKALERAVEMGPALALGHERLGYCLFRERNYDAAVEHYRRAIELEPTKAEGHAGQGVVYMAMYLQQPDNIELRRRAVDCWCRSLQIKPDQPKIRNLIDKYGLKADNPVAAELNSGRP